LLDRSTGGPNPGAKHFQEDLQTVVIEPGRGLQDPGGRRLVTWFEHLGQCLSEIGRQMIHHGRV
jgi:hypothetical protein